MGFVDPSEEIDAWICFVEFMYRIDIFPLKDGSDYFDSVSMESLWELIISHGHPNNETIS